MQSFLNVAIRHSHQKLLSFVTQSKLDVLQNVLKKLNFVVVHYFVDRNNELLLNALTLQIAHALSVRN